MYERPNRGRPLGAASYFCGMKDFTEKIVWITGASSGIGEALAYAFSAAGAKVLLSSRRTEELERVKAACAHPELTRVLPLDLLDHASFAKRTAEAIGAFGHVDIMVHNGGVSSRSLVAETEMEVHRRLMEVDYFSYVALTKALLPHFAGRRSGQFVVMSSVMGKIGTPMRSAYAAAKHALHGFFDCLRAEVSPMNVGVTVLTPGYIRTNIAQHALTKDGSALGQVSKNIEKGLPADKAAAQILRAVGRREFEAYIGKRGGEMFALLLSRWAPGVLMRQAPKLAPK
jgi:dehydrogenase/reductase SDR family protein 7B